MCVHVHVCVCRGLRVNLFVLRCVSVRVCVWCESGCGGCVRVGVGVGRCGGCVRFVCCV